jgi:hypothetical protein
VGPPAPVHRPVEPLERVRRGRCLHGAVMCAHEECTGQNSAQDLGKPLYCT